MPWYSRERSRTDERVIGYNQFQYSLNNGAWITATDYFSSHTFRYKHLIRDVESKRGSPRVIHPVSQYKITVSGPMETVEYSDGAGYRYRPVPGVSWPVHSDAITALAHTVAYSDTVAWQTAVNDAFKAFSSQVPEIVSIGNFIWELREIRSLIPKLEKSLSRTVTGQFLNFEFGWKPFLSDLKKLSMIVSSTQARIQFLRETWGREVRVGFETKLDYPSALPHTATYTPYPGQTTEFRLTDYSSVFRANGYIYQKLEGLDDADAQLRAFSAALGLNNPTKIVWNALPYSFVVDWFAKIGAQLDRLAIQPFEGVYVARRVTNSFKEMYHMDVYQKYFPGSNPSVKVGEILMERYDRSVGLPAGVATTLLSLDSKEQLLGFALIHQRLS